MNLEGMVITKDEMKMENKNDFEILTIKPNKIDNFDFNLPNYLNNIFSLDIFNQETVNHNNFQESIAKYLEVKRFSGTDVETETFHEEEEYIYEMMYLEMPKDHRNETTENQLGSLINIQGKQIYGNIMIFRTYLPKKSFSMTFDNMDKKTLMNALEDRSNVKFLVYEDDTWREERTKDKIDNFSDNFFQDEKYYVKKLELAFLRHNINIWYVVSEYGEDNVCGKLLNCKIEKCIVFSMASEYLRTALSLDEFNKIMKLSFVLEKYDVDEEMIKEERDEYDRLKLKTRHRILEKIFSKYFENNS